MCIYDAAQFSTIEYKNILNVVSFIGKKAQFSVKALMDIVPSRNHLFIRIVNNRTSIHFHS